MFSLLVVLAFFGGSALLTATGTMQKVLAYGTDESYEFLYLQADGKTPVAYDRCQPIHYVTRSQGEPAGGAQIVTEAVSRVSQATGLHFVYDGTTSEAPASQRPPYQPGRYGNRWAPVLISWVTPNENPELADLAGLGGSHIDAKSQIMFERNQRGVTEYGAGDLNGLAALGKGTCLASPVTAQ